MPQGQCRATGSWAELWSACRVQRMAFHVPDATVEGAVPLLANPVKTPGCCPRAELPGHFLRDGHSLFSALLPCPIADLTSCLILTFKHITVLTFVPLFIFLLH